MYLSRVILDDTRRETMRMLGLPNILHGAIECSFPGNRNRRLWRIDSYMGARHLLVLSDDRPDFKGLCAQFCKEAVWETRDYQPLLSRVENGQIWQFRLCANPVRSAMPAPGERGRIYAQVTQDQQREWLLSRSQRHGFTIDNDSFDVTESQWYKFLKGGTHMVTLRKATFEGILTISDAALFREALANGIGREKAYGCGLMTIMRPPRGATHG